jgi:hypothetical protein
MFSIAEEAVLRVLDAEDPDASLSWDSFELLTIPGGREVEDIFHGPDMFGYVSSAYVFMTNELSQLLPHATLRVRVCV